MNFSSVALAVCVCVFEKKRKIYIWEQYPVDDAAVSQVKLFLFFLFPIFYRLWNHSILATWWIIIGHPGPQIFLWHDDGMWQMSEVMCFLVDALFSTPTRRRLVASDIKHGACQISSYNMCG